MHISNLIDQTKEKILINGHIYLDGLCKNYADIIITNKRVLLGQNQNNAQTNISTCPIKGISSLALQYCGNYTSTYYWLRISSYGENSAISAYFPDNQDWKNWAEKIYAVLNDLMLQYC